MDSLTEIGNVLIEWAVAIGRNINNSGMNPTTAFVLGLITMFIIDQILQRVFSWLKWIILAGIIAGLGLSLGDVIGVFTDNAPVVPDVGR